MKRPANKRREQNQATQRDAGGSGLGRAFISERVATLVRAIVLVTAFLMAKLQLSGERAPLENDIVVAGGVLYILLTTFLPLPRVGRRDSALALETGDVIAISALVWVTGGLRSEYYLLYYLPVLFACVRLNLRDAVGAAVLVAVAYLFIGLARDFEAPIVTSGVWRMVTVGTSATMLAFLLALLGQEIELHRQLAETLQAALDRTAAVYDVARAASTGEGLREILETVASQAAAMVDARAGFLALLGEDSELRVEATVMRYEPPSKGSQAEEPTFATAAAKQVLASGAAAVRQPAGRAPGVGILTMPLLGGARVFGVLQVHGQPQQRFRRREVDALLALCAEAAIAIEHTRLRLEVRRLAVTDRLTRLYNRGELEARIQAEVERSQRYEHCLTLVLMDVDRFKQFNDHYGHAAGDQVLRVLADVLHAHTRASDTAGRYGGDEFAVLLPETDLEGGVQMASRLAETFAAQTFPFAPADPSVRAGASIGIASSFSGAVPPQKLMEQADQALYYAKRAGGSCICCYTPEGELRHLSRDGQLVKTK